jgi:hypothetical protein
MKICVIPANRFRIFTDFPKLSHSDINPNGSYKQLPQSCMGATAG